MEASQLNIPISDMIRKTMLTVNIKVTGIRFAQFRLWFGGRLIKLAAMIIGCGVELQCVVDDDKTRVGAV